ncbi:MAG: hypothetical protein ACE5DM_06100 [Candidatus Nanoarchaeia archaeon]
MAIWRAKAYGAVYILLMEAVLARLPCHLVLLAILKSLAKIHKKPEQTRIYKNSVEISSL